MSFDISSLRYSLFAPGLYVGSFTNLGLCGLLVAEHLHHWETPRRSRIAAVGVWSCAGVITYLITAQLSAIAIAALGLGLTGMSRQIFKDYYVTGQILLASLGPMLFCGLGWSLSFLFSLPISPLSRTLLLINLIMGLFTMGCGLVMILPSLSYLYRKRWHRPRSPLMANPDARQPKVSFHVPCYSEPPDVVCATLKALSEIRYQNYEVLVIDNNTIDPNLWKPVQRYCHQLGHRFHFFHVENLTGAKAGALNFALRHTASNAELIAVIDADYQTQPDFLERLVGYFEDPTLGYVQTPHDYRDWEGNFYSQACYWEYMLYFKLHLACVNEWMASHIIGTMCITRRQALEEAGGWAEWCLTEDSECAVRIHALGYSSVFINQTFGRGLIPETFNHYKKQRLRWTIGPIQQIKKHWHLYLPGPLATPSQLTPWQKLIESVHSLGGLRPALMVLGSPLRLATIGSIVYHHEVIPILSILWSMALILMFVGIVQIGLMFYLLGCRSVKAMIGSIIASISLSYVRVLGAFDALSFWKKLPWIRTHKFKVVPNRLAALQTTKVEIGLAVLSFGLGAAIAPYASVRPPDLLLLVSIGLMSQAFSFLMAPLMAFMAELQLSHPTQPRSTPTPEPLVSQPVRKI